MDCDLRIDYIILMAVISELTSQWTPRYPKFLVKDWIGTIFEGVPGDGSILAANDGVRRR